MTEIMLRLQFTKAIGKMMFSKEKVDLLGINKKRRELLYLMDIGMKMELNLKEKLWLMIN